MNLVPFGQRGKPSVARERTALKALAAGQVSADRLVFYLRTQLPAPYLAALIERH